MPLTCVRVYQEVQHGDDLVLLACHLLLDMGRSVAVRPALASGAGDASSPQMAYLTEAVVLLEAGRKESGYNFQFSLLALECYKAMGCFDCARAAFKALDVKHIMVDSLSYLILDDAMAYGFFSFAKDACGVRPTPPCSCGTRCSYSLLLTLLVCRRTCMVCTTAQRRSRPTTCGWRSAGATTARCWTSPRSATRCGCRTSSW